MLHCVQGKAFITIARMKQSASSVISRSAEYGTAQIKRLAFPRGSSMAIMRPLRRVERWTSSEERASTAMGVVSVTVWYRTTPRPLCIVVCYYLHMVFDL
jgi:hypothetical protein